MSADLFLYRVFPEFLHFSFVGREKPTKEKSMRTCFSFFLFSFATRSTGASFFLLKILKNWAQNCSSPIGGHGDHVGHAEELRGGVATPHGHRHHIHWRHRRRRRRHRHKKLPKSSSHVTLCVFFNKKSFAFRSSKNVKKKNKKMTISTRSAPFQVEPGTSSRRRCDGLFVLDTVQDVRREHDRPSRFINTFESLKKNTHPKNRWFLLFRGSFSFTTPSPLPVGGDIVSQKRNEREWKRQTKKRQQTSWWWMW